MKKILYIFTLLSLLLTSCEDVVDVDLTTAEPKLVVDASLDWAKGSDGNLQVIKLSTTSSYYTETVPPALGAVVSVSDGLGQLFTFTDVANNGQYICTDFAPVIGQTYTLTIVYEGETYKAVETLLKTPDIVNITQKSDGGFMGDQIEVRFYFQDNPDEQNNYLARIDAPFLAYPDYSTTDDEFTNGNMMYGIISDEDLDVGQVVGIKLHSISKRYKNYMDKLIEVAGGSGAGPFSTPPATVRGNVVNQTNQSNYPLGYFRVTQVDNYQYTVQ
nr:DUF4249 domain-containing protein [uncultured Flavobacterium sp.]